MAIKMINAIPLITLDDIKDPERLEQILTAFKLYCEELATKAKAYQSTVRSDAPSVNELDEGQDVGDDTGNKEYIKLSGAIYSKALTAV